GRDAALIAFEPRIPRVDDWSAGRARIPGPSASGSGRLLLDTSGIPTLDDARGFAFELDRHHPPRRDRLVVEVLEVAPGEREQGGLDGVAVGDGGHFLVRMETG